MSNNQFRELLVELTGHIAGRSLDQDLQDWLNQEHGVDSDTYRQLQASCEQGVEEGWLCQHEAGGIRFGRAFKPDDELHRFSVDVVDMDNVVGPHHAHPNGEIDLISKGSSLKLCMVAEGTADAYPRFAPTMEWDTAAGQAVCEAAGCQVIDQGTQRTMLYNREELLNSWFLVSRNN